MSILGLHIVDVLVIAAYFSVVLFIGYRALKKIRNSEDYFLGGRQFGRFFQTFSQFGQATSSESAVQVVSMVGVNGLAAAVSSMVIAVPKTFIAWLFPKWLRRLRLMSMADYFVDRFHSRKLAALYAVASASLFVLVGGMGLYAMSKTVCAIAEKPIEKLTVEERAEYDRGMRLEHLEQTPADLLGEADRVDLELLRKQRPRTRFSFINQEWLIVGMAFFVLLYAAGGGLEAAVYTDAMQSVFILVLTVLLIPFAMVKLNALHATSGMLGPFVAIHRILPESLFEIFGSPRWVEFKWYNIIVLMLMGMAGNIAFANNLVVSGAARTEKIASFGGMTGILIRLVSGMFWMLLALFILGIFGEHVTDPDLMWGMAARTLLPTGLLGLMMACLLAALMSTADTHMMTVSGLLTQNIYKPLFPDRPDGHYVNVGRVLGVVYIVGAVVLALHASNIYRMCKAMGFITVACGPAMLMGFLWRRTNARAVWASMGISLLITLFLPVVAAVSPGIKENPAMLVEVRAPRVIKTYTARERDVVSRRREIEKWDRLQAEGLAQGDRPQELRVDEKFEKTYEPPPRAVFWDENIKMREDGTLYGSGFFKPEMVTLHFCGMDFKKYTPAQVEFISLLIRLVFPFLAVVVVGLLTRPVDKKSLDRFYAKMLTPVNADHDQDPRDVASSQADPSRLDHRKLFPASNWEFTRQESYDIKGMLVGTLIALVLAVILVLIAGLGK